MKITALTLLLLISSSAFGQEEFLKKSPGISVGIAHSNIPENDNINSFGFSAVLGYGVSINIIGNAYQDEIYPTIGFTLMPGHKEKDSYVLPLFNVAYSKADAFTSFGFTAGIMQCIHMHSDYPLSISGSLSFQSLNTTLETRENPYSGTVQFSYTQAFWAKGDIYPFLGVAGSYNSIKSKDIEGSSMIYHFTLGINMNLGS